MLNYRYVLIFSMGLFSGLLLQRPFEHALCSPVLTNAHQEADFKSTLPVVGKIIVREGYIVCYDARSRNPYYVVEELTAESLRGNADRSSHLFREDENIPERLRASLADYKGSGLDRGHMAPAANCRKSIQLMAESFFLSNVCPQDAGLNRGYWLAFEKHVRGLAKHYKKVQVITGPLYMPQGEPGERFVRYRCIGPNDVAVPNAFFKMIRLEQERGDIEERAYIMPNAYIAPETPLEAFQVTTQKLERLAELFLPNKRGDQSKCFIN